MTAALEDVLRLGPMQRLLCGKGMRGLAGASKACRRAAWCVRGNRELSITLKNASTKLSEEAAAAATSATFYHRGMEETRALRRKLVNLETVTILVPPTILLSTVHGLKRVFEGVNTRILYRTTCKPVIVS